MLLVCQRRVPPLQLTELNSTFPFWIDFECIDWFISQIQFANAVGRFDLDVTTFQMAVLFAWNERPKEKISLENLRLATELPDAELRRTLWVRPSIFSHQLSIVIHFSVAISQSLVAFPKLKRQLLTCCPEVQSPRDFTENSIFCVNQDFSLMYFTFHYFNSFNSLLESDRFDILFYHFTYFHFTHI